MGHKRKFNRSRQRAQGRHDRHDRPTRPQEWSPPSPTDSRETFVGDELGFLLDMALANTEPLAFVGYVSSTLAVIADHGGINAMRRFIERTGDDATTNGHALLIGIANMAPMADDRAHATRLLARRSSADRDRLPSWITGFEQAVAVKAFRHQELGWDSSFGAIELQLGDHSLCVFADFGHVERYIITKGHLYPGTVNSFLDEYPQAAMTAGTSIDYVELGRAGAQFAEAVRRSDEIEMEDVFLDDMWRAMGAEILWAARLASAAAPFDAPSPTDQGIDPLFDPSTSELTPAEVDGVISDFRRSLHGRQAFANKLDQGLDLIVAYGTTAGHCRLESWGPRRVGMFLHAYVLAEVWASDIDLSTVPRLLEHWIQFTNERAEMPAAMAQETIERIHEVIPIYDALLRARDRSLQATADQMVAARLRE